MVVKNVNLQIISYFICSYLILEHIAKQFFLFPFYETHEGECWKEFKTKTEKKI